jgi:predicted HTH transcriptional regulator
LLSLEKVILLVYNHTLTENIRAAFMDKAKIIELINQGEDSRTQFKENFTNNDQLVADEMLIPESTIEDINYFIFNKFFENNYEQSVKETGQPIEKLLENLKLFRDGRLNLAGLLLFGLNPQKFKPIFIIKGVSFYGNDIAGTEYRGRILIL